MNADLIVMACHSATAAAIKEIRERFDIPIVGVEPYLKMADELVKQDHNSKILVLLTELTSNSEKFLKLKEEFANHTQIKIEPMHELATFIEEGFDQKESTDFYKKLNTMLEPYKNQNFSHVILGCTHYNLIADQISKTLSSQCISTEKYIVKRPFYEKTTIESKSLVFLASLDNS